MRTTTLLATALAAGISLPVLAQSGDEPAAPAGKPPSTVPGGGRGMPAHQPGQVETVPSGGRGMNDVNGAGNAGAGAGNMVDLNTADAATLKSSLGLSSGDAKAIVKYRDDHGALTSQAQLAEIKGLSRGGAEKMKGHVQFGARSPGAMPEQ